MTTPTSTEPPNDANMNANAAPTPRPHETQSQSHDTETPTDRAARKLQAKNLKRERIAAAGGKRPRSDKPKLNNNNNANDNNRNNNNNNNNNKNKNKSRAKKKQKRNSNSNSNNSSSNSNSSSRFGRVMEQTPCPNQPRHSTLSIALPGSVITNAQTHELRTHMVGQIARAAAVYHVDEIIVYDDSLADDIPLYNAYSRNRDRDHGRDRNNRNRDNDRNNNDNSKNELNTPSASPKTSTDPHTFMARLFQYMECPQYLRKQFFPHHPDLQYAGLLPPLDAPHHVRAHDRSMFREGVVLDKQDSQTGHSFVHCGVPGRNILIDRTLSPGIRCTIQLNKDAYSKPGKSMQGTVVGPATPRQHDGTYWGYTTRLASSMKAVFDESIFAGKYDLKIGTSERGTISVDDLDFVDKLPSPSFHPQKDADFDTDDGDVDGDDDNSFQHALIVFGGVAGIEECVDADETTCLSGSDSKSLFDLWVNICPHQGSRTIRTEEAVLLGLARLRPHLFPIAKTPTNKSHIMSSGAVNNTNNEVEENVTTFKNSAAGVTNETVTVEFSDAEPSDESSCNE